MSTDPQPFEEDLDALEAQAAPEEAAPAPAAQGKAKKAKKEKKPKAPKAPKAKKVKLAKPKSPRSSGGLVRALYRWFPDVYTTLLGLAALGLLIAVVLLLLEVMIPYGGQMRPAGSL